MTELLDCRQIRIDPAWALRIPPALALRRLVLPFAADEQSVFVACANAQDAAALEAVERFVGRPIQAEVADEESLRLVVQRVFGSTATPSDGRTPVMRTDFRQGADLDPNDAVALCDELLFAALVREASDIHIDPGAENVSVRLRVDGELEPYRTMPASVLGGLISRFKVIAGMDIAEKRAPQDGAFTHRFGAAGGKIDVRVATLPTKYGERMTLRLLAAQTESLTVERLGMSPPEQEVFERAVASPHGLVLLTGPTGSGKTTTLYAALRRLITAQVGNIITIEDPIEYSIPGVAQVEVDSADKVSFGRALRSVLRHDPDVVMIGEIRDLETADVAIKASLTGHLVFSTLHTNSAVGVVTRLADMGVQRYLIAATLRLAVSQRLVRRLCPRCRQPRALTTAEAASLRRLDDAGRQVFDPAGCKFCANRGLSGRLGLFEMLPCDEELARLIADGASEPELMLVARRHGCGTLLDDAAAKAYAGQTTIREVLSAVTGW
ncbi:MAG: GspE/PulE family protein [Pirellulales bacterium]